MFNGTSAWAKMPAGLGVLAGAAPSAAPCLFEGPTRAALGDLMTVTPGGSAMFNFYLSAPRTAGSAVLQWQMVRELVGSFGARSAPVEIITQCSGPSPAQRLQAAVNAAFASGLPTVVAEEAPQTSRLSWP